MSDTTARPVEGPAGIGGWLILPIVTLVVTVGLSVVHMAQAATELANLGAIWAGGLPGRTAVLAALLASLLGAVAVSVTGCLGLWRIVGRSLRTRATMTVHYLVLMTAGAVEAVADGVLTANFGSSVHDPTVLRELVWAVTAGTIGIAYFHRSRRVANTFVN